MDLISEGSRGHKVCKAAWLLCRQIQQCLWWFQNISKYFQEVKVSLCTVVFLMHSLWWIFLRGCVFGGGGGLFCMDGGQNAEKKMLFPIYLHYCWHGFSRAQRGERVKLSPFSAPELSHSCHLHPKQLLSEARVTYCTPFLAHAHQAQTQTKNKPVEDGKMLAFLEKATLIGSFTTWQPLL